MIGYEVAKVLPSARVFVRDVCKSKIKKKQKQIDDWIWSGKSASLSARVFVDTQNARQPRLFFLSVDAIPGSGAHWAYCPWFSWKDVKAYIRPKGFFQARLPSLSNDRRLGCCIFTPLFSRRLRRGEMENFFYLPTYVPVQGRVGISWVSTFWLYQGLPSREGSRQEGKACASEVLPLPSGNRCDIKKDCVQEVCFTRRARRWLGDFPHWSFASHALLRAMAVSGARKAQIIKLHLPTKLTQRSKAQTPPTSYTRVV